MYSRMRLREDIVADDMLVVTALPDRKTWCIAQFINFARGKCFEGPNNFG